MSSPASAVAPAALPSPRAVLELLKPVTWFPPMWALACGMVSSGASASGRWLEILTGIVLAGPLLCGASQVVNDWFDREVDAVNEPYRPIPSGRVPGRWGLGIAVAWSLLAALVAWQLGPWVFGPALLGIALSWAYSAPPLRFKQNGWIGNAAVGLAYEGLPWVTGAALLTAGAAPGLPVIVLALLYSLGAHGIMTLNDFKALEGDRRHAVRSLPVQLGPARAARLACVVMALPQVVVVVLLLAWQAPLHAGAVAALLVGQLLAMARLVRRPRELAPWYNATGVTMYVAGMMTSAFALAGMAA
ncbi:MAG: chlorophyll synthase ChlG [Gammaproteobacteria bacterium]